MAEIINLRTIRKQAARKQADKQADANRLAHGLSAAEREHAAAIRDKDSRGLDGHRRNDPSRDGGDKI